jgi:hypothetical protein
MSDTPVPEIDAPQTPALFFDPVAGLPVTALGSVLLDAIPHGEGTLVGFTVAMAREIGASPVAIGAALQGWAHSQITAIATGLRAQIAPTGDPGKLEEYNLKAEIAGKPASQRKPEEVAILTREATARGLTLDQLVAVIVQRKSALRLATLEIAGWEATEKAALAALDPASPDIETLVAEALATARATANTLIVQIQGAS